MAKVFGESGRYVSEESVKHFGKIMTLALIGLMLSSGVAGFFIAKNNLFLIIAGFLLAVLIFVIFYRLAIRHERFRFNYLKGADGEDRVGKALSLLPEEYNVINDLQTDSGNIDHVIIGPTGVYVLDTKNWRGIISADVNGELLVNGKPTDRPVVKIFTARIMNIKEKIETLCGHVRYIQAVFVFTSASVNAKWGTTGSVHCMRDEQLYDYIVNNKTRLSKKEIDDISQAFLALARMDKDFNK